MVRDEFGCKPAMVAVGERYVAVASEFRRWPSSPTSPTPRCSSRHRSTCGNARDEPGMSGPAGARRRRRCSTASSSAPARSTRRCALPSGSRARILNPRGRHSLVVGMLDHLDVAVEGDAGHYAGGCAMDPTSGSTGSPAGPPARTSCRAPFASPATPASGWARPRTAARSWSRATPRPGPPSRLKGGTVVVAGDVGNFSAFMAQAGVLLVGGDAGEALGDSLYEAVVYVAGASRASAATHGRESHRR